jgi:hypothetical protein
MEWTGSLCDLLRIRHTKTICVVRSWKLLIHFLKKWGNPPLHGHATSGIRSDHQVTGQLYWTGWPHSTCSIRDFVPLPPLFSVSFQIPLTSFCLPYTFNILPSPLLFPCLFHLHIQHQYSHWPASKTLAQIYMVSYARKLGSCTSFYNSSHNSATDNTITEFQKYEATLLITNFFNLLVF